MEKHTCPKCKSELIKQETTYALPQYVPHDERGKDGLQINPKSALPVEIYYCESCRHVELVAE